MDQYNSITITDADGNEKTFERSADNHNEWSNPFDPADDAKPITTGALLGILSSKLNVSPVASASAPAHS